MDPDCDYTPPITLTVCLVDDDPLIRTLFTRVIRRAGHNVVAAEDETHALDLLSNSAIHLVVSDWRMPDSADGERLLRLVGQGFPHLCLCVMSGLWTSDEMALATKLGARTCITKPFTSKEFSELITTLNIDPIHSTTIDTSAEFTHSAQYRL